MQLVEQGKVDLSKPFADYLPALGNGSRTTVKQLLNQTSGIGTYSTLEHFQSADTPVAYEYSNVNYNLLGKIVEQVSGMDYGSYIEKHIFVPLNMQHSFASLEEAKSDGLLGGNRNYFGFMVEQEVNYPETEITGWLTLPSAYIISSAEDMGKYLQAYLNGGRGILSQESTQTMLHDTVSVQEGYQYGMGWGVDQRTGETIYTHGGNVENYTTNMQILPERGIAVIVMFNACDYLVANEMALRLAYNITYQLTGEETTDIQSMEYVTNHLVINVILLAVVIVSLLPLFLLKRWCRKAKKQVKPTRIVLLILIHAVFPTVLLALFPLLGIPMSVVSGFAPDVFMVQIISSAVLYLTGVCKIAYLFWARHNKKAISFQNG